MPLKPLLKQSAVTLALGAERLVRGRPRTTPENLAGFRDFLFLQYMMPLGYCVHDTPIYEALRQCRPDARITVATRAIGYQTLRHNPYIDYLITTESPFTGLRTASGELRQALRSRGVAPQVGITNFSNPRTRITLLNMLAGPHVRLGHTLARSLYHLPQTYDRGTSLIDNNLRLLANFGCAPAHVEPRIFFSEADVQKARTLLQPSQGAAGSPVVVFVTQTSGGQRTGWHPDRFSRVIRYAVEQMAACPVFVGTSADAAPIDALRRLAAERSGRPSLPGISLAGQTNIPELASLLCLADYVVSLDTGTMHMARAAGVPMVVLGPSWQQPLEWLPLGIGNVRILRGEDIDHVPEGYQLDEVEAEAVIAALDELVTLYPPSALERAARVKASLSDRDHAKA